MPDLSAFPITRKWPATHPERLVSERSNPEDGTLDGS